MDNELDHLGDDILTADDATLHPDRPLSPRHRKVAELWARGMRNQEIADDLHYTKERVSAIKQDPRVRALAMQYMDQAYEENIGKRIRKMAEPALNILEACLADERGVFKKSEQLDTAKWLLEKIDGKAVQKHEVGGGILVGIMDKLDAMKDVSKTIKSNKKSIIDVTPQDGREKLMLSKAKVPKAVDPEEKAKTEEELLKAWVLDNI